MAMIMDRKEELLIRRCCLKICCLL